MAFPLCGWFSNMETNGKAIFLSRLCWLLSFSLVWVGLLTEGWQLVKFEAPGPLANRIRETVHYGLWRIKYTGTYSNTSDYLDWEPEASDVDDTAYPRVQATRACVVLALMALCLQFLVSIRGYCARSEKVQRTCTILCATLASADLAFTLLAVLVWKSIPDMAFHVLCSERGCNVSPFGGDAFQMTPFYAWGFFIVKCIFAFPGVVSLIYLAVPASSSSSSSSEAATETPAATAVTAESGKKGGKKGKKEAVLEKAGDDAIIAQEEGNGGSPKTNGSAGSAASSSSSSSMKGGKKGGETFDRDAPVSYVAGSAGDPNPAWLKS